MSDKATKPSPPPRPPQALLPVPATRIPARTAKVASLVKGLAAPSPIARHARAQAALARKGIEQHIMATARLRDNLKAALAQHDAHPDAATEWTREGVDVQVVRAVMADLETTLRAFTETPEPAAASA
jgi:hypothetical protein